MGNRKDLHPSLDVVIPVYDEEEVLGLLVERLRNVFSEAAVADHGLGQVRFLFVDDGSTDRTAELVRGHIEEGLPATLCRLSRNFGHQNAVSAGLARSTGDLVAVIDADLQDPPELLLDMVAEWRKGSDVVYARRAKRRENPVKRVGYFFFYRLAAWLSEITIPLDAGDFSLMDRRVVDAMLALPEKLRFPRGLRAWVGFSQTGIEYDRPTRQAGRPKYGLRRLYRLATDGIASSSIRPLRVAQLFSFCFAILTVVILAFLVGALITRPASEGTLFFLLAYLLIAGGNFVQAFCFYILGAYVGRTYLEAKGRPSYLVMDTYGDDER